MSEYEDIGYTESDSERNEAIRHLIARQTVRQILEDLERETTDSDDLAGQQ